ncbi:putative RNA polymerase sigma factor FecI [Pseudomonas reidholzensis]|uniref:Putative RNA polymerase sigma factor FecI n=1 Tax=Pseudomonas reidholzensis TaxID=1785162 RepID=A0A383RQH2_9PSED|nr:sigma-70 family RNA polymerase sigma factor [Pseudomonas reidholzensis]SYX88904.1 putative RNA polymerase sigma factor FecI [Pseudomonas reidholzensis]
MPDSAAAPEACLSTLYRDHRSWLESWLSRRLGDRWEAADLAQDTFVRVLAAQQTHSLPSLREPRAYLLTVGKRLLINHYQRRSLERAYLDALANLPEQVAPSPEQRWLLLETLYALDELLDGLPRPVRQAFLWSQLEGIDYATIGARLNVSERTVKRYMAKAYEHCLLVEL